MICYAMYEYVWEVRPSMVSQKSPSHMTPSPPIESSSAKNLGPKSSFEAAQPDLKSPVVVV